MEISRPTLGIFYISKILGLAPFALRQNAKGWLEIRRSILFSIFSTSLILIMVSLTYRGLLFDANSKIPVRMKSATSKVVTALDVSVVVLATTAGVICGLLGVNSTKELNRRLRKVDETLHTFANEKKDRVRTFIMVLVPMTAITTLLGLDIWTWLRFADQMSNGIENADLNVQWYIPFYSLYYILTGLQISFANTAFGLGRRYRRLNLMLRSSFLGQGDIKYDLVLKQNTTKIKTIFPLTLNASMVKASSDSNVQYDGAAAKKQSRLLQGLAEHHASLCHCVFIVSSSYGVAVLFILVSCLLHLVATSYFLFLEFLNTKDNGYLWLQILWIGFHTFRLLMVVEPCHLATRESKKSLQIICEIERKTHDPILAEEIKKFWQQLLVSESEFSAMGLCKVNRNILTSFSSAIATYLIILIQFQKSNG